MGMGRRSLDEWQIEKAEKYNRVGKIHAEQIYFSE